MTALVSAHICPWKEIQLTHECVTRINMQVGADLEERLANLSS